MYLEAKNGSEVKKKMKEGGISNLLENGKIFDKVGVNFSEVYGKFPIELKGKIPGTKKTTKFWASGISIVMHMKNPHVPAMHFNTRYINTSHGWFGGGMDVTPCFKDHKLKKWLHKNLKKMCDRHNKKYYKNIANGVMNIFIYHIEVKLEVLVVYFLITKKTIGKENFNFVKDVGLEFIKVFNEIIQKKIKLDGQKKIKKFNMLKEADMLNLIFYMTEGQNLVYKQVEI